MCSTKLLEILLELCFFFRFSDDRAHIAMVQSLGWTVGMCLMPVILWITGDWVYFLLITSLPQLIFICFYKYGLHPINIFQVPELTLLFFFK